MKIRNGRADTVSVDLFRWCLMICVVGYTVVFWGKAAALEVMSLGEGGASPAYIFVRT